MQSSAICCFPNNLALLTRIIAIALLVLSLDLVTGYCGVATLGHAALFGAGAYAAGIAAAHFGITEPMTMVADRRGRRRGSGLAIRRDHPARSRPVATRAVHCDHPSFPRGGQQGLGLYRRQRRPGRHCARIRCSGLFAVRPLGSHGLSFRRRRCCVIVFIALRQLVRSPFGMLCRGIREDPVRIRAMGASVRGTLLKMYVISGAVAGIGGALDRNLHAGRRA